MYSNGSMSVETYNVLSNSIVKYLQYIGIKHNKSLRGSTKNKRNIGDDVNNDDLFVWIGPKPETVWIGPEQRSDDSDHSFNVKDFLRESDLVNYDDIADTDNLDNLADDLIDADKIFSWVGPEPSFNEVKTNENKFDVKTNMWLLSNRIRYEQFEADDKADDDSHKLRQRYHEYLWFRDDDTNDIDNDKSRFFWFGPSPCRVNTDVFNKMNPDIKC